MDNFIFCSDLIFTVLWIHIGSALCKTNFIVTAKSDHTPNSALIWPSWIWIQMCIEVKRCIRIRVENNTDPKAGVLLVIL